MLLYLHAHEFVNLSPPQMSCPTRYTTHWATDQSPQIQETTTFILLIRDHVWGHIQRQMFTWTHVSILYFMIAHQTDWMTVCKKATETRKCSLKITHHLPTSQCFFSQACTSYHSRQIIGWTVRFCGKAVQEDLSGWEREADIAQLHSSIINVTEPRITSDAHAN